MYVFIRGENNPAKNPRQSSPYGTWISITLIDKPELELPIREKLEVKSDEGFLLVEIDPKDYARQTYVNGILTFTNAPAPEPAPEPTPEEIAQQLQWRKEERIRESKDALRAFLDAHPLIWQDGLAYSVTEEKQSLLTSQLALQSIAEQAGVERELTWNSTGGICVPWTLENLSALALAIGAYVQPLVKHQQTLEVQIQACETEEAVNAIVIDYSVENETTT